MAQYVAVSINYCVSEMFGGQMPGGQVYISQMPFGKMVFDEKTWNHHSLSDTACGSPLQSFERSTNIFFQGTVTLFLTTFVRNDL
jgi:hypothetical protein